MTIEAPQKPLTGAENILWDLSLLYSGVDDPQIDQDMQQIEAMAEAFAARYKGSVGELDAAELLEAVQTLETLYDKRTRLASYATLVYTTNTADPRNGALVAKTREHGAKIEQMLVFFELEWANAAEAYVAHVLADPRLANYQHALAYERIYRPYQLTEAEEQIVLEKDVTGRSAWSRFFTQVTSAIRLDLDGEKVNLTDALAKLHDPDRDTRIRAADAITAGLRANAMPLTYIFNVLAADKAASDARRGYPSWLAARNLANKAPDAVVEALVASVTAHYDLVARHYTLKRTLLGLDELTDVDRYAPLPMRQSDRRYSWDEARDIVLTAFRSFSPQMGEVAARFFDEHWIHAAPHPDKQGGAYAHPLTPQTHPYVFINYTGTANDVATLAHELGHGIHMVLSGRQTLYNYYTPLTTAEMASVFAEMVVFRDLMAREDDAEARLGMLVSKIEDTFATVFRQTAMNRFEAGYHTARRTQGELTTEQLSSLWMEAQRAMFGDSVTLRPDYGLWWSYVSHFVQTPGYVYAYAFGELLVLALFELYQERGADFIPEYLEVLAAGGSDFPDKILAKVGVDLNDPAFWNKGLAVVRGLVEQEEALAKAVYPAKFA